MSTQNSTVIKQLKDEIVRLDAQIAELTAKVPKKSDTVGGSPGIALVKSGNNYEAVKLSVTDDNSAQVTERVPLGQDFLVAAYKTRQLFEMEIILGRKG